MDIFYTHEKLTSATAAMGEDDRPGCERLYDAYLELHVLAPHDFPQPFDNQYREIVDEILRHKRPATTEELAGEPRPGDHPLSQMAEEDCRRLLEDIRALEKGVRTAKESQIKGWRGTTPPDE